MTDDPPPAVTEPPQDAVEPRAAVPISELRKLADVLAGLDVELADDYIAGLANRVLRDLARRWADTVHVWVLEAELWGEPSGAPPRASDDLTRLLQEAVLRVASLTGRRPADLVCDLATHFAAPGRDVPA